MRFSKEQAGRLVKILTTESKEELEEVECYDPHHGFVFYDKDWKVVGWFEVCFLCSDSVASSKAVPENVGLLALEAFAREAGLPVFEEEAGYAKLYQQENPPPAFGEEEGRAKKAPASDDDPFAAE